MKTRDVMKEERILLTAAERQVLQAYQQYLITPGQMLCFFGPDLERKKATLERMSDKQLLARESFDGGYSLTKAGFVAMNESD